ncbi:hypothetical protein BGX28_007574 [Mortierella sp. GBA30]|nr:hypothetical protein BGX28_007574 [Mortierella sp. GBA30]
MWRSARRICLVSANGVIVENTPADWAYTLEKYDLTARLGDGDLDSDAIIKVPLVDVRWDRQYYGEVGIGYPVQMVRLQFDTGSSRLAVSASECPQCAGTAHFNRAASRTFNQGAGQAFHITYGHGISFVSGVMGQDTVVLGSLTIQHQDLSLVLDESTQFERSVDGILGLSLGAMSGYKTVFQNMVEQGVVGSGIFAFYLGKYYLSGGGEVAFGGVDMSKVAPGDTITYTNVVDPTRWMVNLEDAIIEGKSLRSFKGEAALPALIDTGTTLLVLPEEIADWINEQIPYSRYINRKWFIPCNSASNLEFVFEGREFKVPAQDLVRERTELGGLCYSGVQTSSGNYMVIGDVFIKNNYVVFDQDNHRVGFAPLS